MRNNINWDVCPDWVRFRTRDTRSEDFERSEDTHEEERRHCCDEEEEKKRCPCHEEEHKRCHDRKEEHKRRHNHKEEQRHVHEFLGSTEIVAEEEDEEEEVHNHRFAGVSGEAIPTRGSHVHRIRTRTDFFDHFHEIEDVTGPAIEVGNGKHVHFDKGETTVNDGHEHDFQFATLIESPLIQEKKHR